MINFTLISLANVGKWTILVRKISGARFCCSNCNCANIAKQVQYPVQKLVIIMKQLTLNTRSYNQDRWRFNYLRIMFIIM